MIAESTPDDLPSTCYSLLEFFLHMQQFQMVTSHLCFLVQRSPPLFWSFFFSFSKNFWLSQIVGDLAHSETALCRKNRDAALESKRKGNECFSSGDYMKALSLYSQVSNIVSFLLVALFFLFLTWFMFFSFPLKWSITKLTFKMWGEPLLFIRIKWEKEENF